MSPFYLPTATEIVLLAGLSWKTIADLKFEVPVKKPSTFEPQPEVSSGDVHFCYQAIYNHHFGGSPYKNSAPVYGAFLVGVLKLIQIHNTSIVHSELAIASYWICSLHPISAPLRLTAQSCLCGSPAKPRNKM